MSLLRPKSSKHVFDANLGCFCEALRYVTWNRARTTREIGINLRRRNARLLCPFGRSQVASSHECSKRLAIGTSTSRKWCGLCGLHQRCRLPHATPIRRLQASNRARPNGGNVATTLAAGLGLEADFTDESLLVDRLYHVVDRQRSDRHCSERFHLDSGWSCGLDGRENAHAVFRVEQLELDSCLR